ncbi:glycosyltransferase family 2 protein [Alteromonas flava]|uniref:glycosyltransferase family 2 protein n=1 Tax=Alteromonas flava TaxID=2048003 RepID=UPI000C29497D|nr:glycosyltransferase family 2 protein [Alteromonas flava]
MKKVKSLVKRLIGRSASTLQPVTVDICSKTSSGFVVIGWYLSDQVNALAIVDNDGNNLESDLTDIQRQDVVAQIGQPAQGFQLIFDTEVALANIVLVASLTSGEVKRIPLVFKNAEQFVSPPVEAANGGELHPIDIHDKASCEFAIVSSTHIYLAGWADDASEQISATLIDRKNKSVANIVKQLRIGRRDVQEALAGTTKLQTGFMLLLERNDSKAIKQGDLRLTVQLDDTEELTVPVREIFDVTSEPMNTLKRLLNAWVPHDPTQLASHGLFRPILEALYPANKTADVRRVDIGRRIEAPRASIVIPLYGRYDFMRYQLSHFDRYAEYHDVEILYVVDDPRLNSFVEKLSKHLRYSIQHPFSVLYLAENVGFGKANNIAVKHTSSENLVLLNSDVLPSDDSWLQKMLNVAEQKTTGIVGARLLFEDDTIQHDGMAPMTLHEYPGLYFNDHPKKGWPKQLVNVSTVLRKMPLLTAACWVMRKEVFTEVGGFDPVYVLGDFEDSDLCFKALALGYTNYICHDAELYHLERQSQNLVESGHWKHNLTILNAITFNEKWKSQIVKIIDAGAAVHE